MYEITSQLKFDDKGLIPAITQDHRTDEVLMMAYMNAESLQKTIETGKVHYYSRSRQKLWLKGETSGHFQNVKSISIDCDSDTLLLKVEQTGAACHTGHRSCFYRKLDAEGLKGSQEAVLESEQSTPGPQPESGDSTSAGPEVLQELYEVIVDRAIHPKEGSYTKYLFDKGLDKILKKVGEEAAEVIVAAKNQSKDEIKCEVADLLYHIMVLLVERGMKPEDIYKELKARR